MDSLIWQKVLNDISISIDSTRFETWFKSLYIENNSDSNTLEIITPNKYICDFLQQNYLNFILSFVKKYDSKINSISFVVSNKVLPTSEVEKSSTISQLSNKKTSISSTILNKRFTFDSFVVGPGNQFAKSAALAVAQSPGKTKFNPLLIYSGVGLGKTHLIQAIGNYIISFFPSFKVVYISSEEFYLSFIDAIKTNSTKLFTEKFRSCDVLLMDDVQFFSGKESTQEEFFYIFNTLYQNGKQIVITSDLPPNSLKGLHERLISRFQWGLCVDIQPPNLETRVAILKKKAEEDKLDIPENVLYYISEQVSSNIRELEGIIIRLLAYSSITKMDITIELVKSILGKSKLPDHKISIDEIIEKVSDYFSVPVNNIREKNRRKEVAYCRHIAMYLSKLFTSYSLKTIGLHFGGRDHSTVVHAINIIEKLRKQDQNVEKDLTYFISLFRNKT